MDLHVFYQWLSGVIPFILYLLFKVVKFHKSLPGLVNEMTVSFYLFLTRYN